nr:hypothetical protein [Burkholderia metallica]
MSFSYHVGNGLFGGLLPAISAAIQTSTGDIFGGLWYTAAVSGLTFFVALLFLPSKARVQAQVNAGVLSS